MKKKYIFRTIKVLSLVFAVLLFVEMGQKYIFTFYDEGNKTRYDANKTRLEGFYLEPKDTIDVVLLGASDVFSDFSSAYAYKEFEFTSYPYAIDSSPVNLFESQIKEIQRYQNPKLIVIEINGALYDSNDADEYLHKEGFLRRYIDSIPFSLNKCSTILNVTPSDEWINYFFPITKYHGNWKNSLALINSSKNFTDLEKRGYSLLKGNYTHTINQADKNALSNIENDRSSSKLDSESEKYLRDFIEFCKDENINNIVFTRFPHIISNDELYQRFKRCNEAERIIKENGFEFINLENKNNLIGLETSDYYDYDHLNIYGQKKFTEYFSKLITQKYDIEKSKLTDEVRNNWELSAEYYDLFYEYCENKIEEQADEWVYEKSNVIQELDKLKASKQ